MSRVYRRCCGATAIAAERSGVAGEGAEHLVMRKYALFESGRWPLGVVGGQLFLF